MARIELCRLDHLDGDRLLVDTPDGDPVLVIRHGDEVHVIDAMCPHQYAPLLGGDVDADGILTCNLHGWRFRLSDGRSPDSEYIQVQRWPCGVEDGVVWIEE